MASDTKTFRGSCHCGFIEYTVDLGADLLANPTVTRCNCTMCQKPGFIALSVKPEQFKLVSHGSKTDLPDYQFRSKDCHRYFCRKCGVQVYGEGQYELEGTKYDFFTVNVSTLDQPQEGLDLSQWKVTYIDGLKDNWMAGTQDKPWAHGVI